MESSSENGPTGKNGGTKDVELQNLSKLETGQNEAQHGEDEEQYPPLKVVIPTILSIYMAIFLTALDRTIIGVAIPSISNEFQSFSAINWYEAAFLLTMCVFQLPMGKIYKYYSAKWTLVAIVIIFEVGSIVCAAAPSSNAFIVGRAIAGIGAAGTIVGAQVNLRALLPLRKRPKYQGFVGAVFGLASIIGPLVGGVFTTDVSWRMCFWLSVPIGGLALAGLVFILPASPPPEKMDGTFLEILKRFDPIGNMLLAPGVVCLLLAMQWGGTKFPWNDGRVIALLVVGSVSLITFMVVQCFVQENGTVPPRVLCQRSIASGIFVSLGLSGTMIITTFYLPIWFQAIEGTSASSAGVRLLPYFLATVVFVMASGTIISKIGYYTPFLTAGTAILVVGTGLLTTLRANTSNGQWIGYQILIGAGMGLSLQQCTNAAQTVLAKQDISTGITILVFSQNFGGTLFVSVSQTILSNTLRSQLARTLPGFDVSAISNSGATDIRNLVSTDKLPTVLIAYNAGIDNVFYCALATSCLALVASLFVEWKSVRSKVGMSPKS